MKPAEYIMVIKDDPKEFEDQINSLLKEGYVFFGDLHQEGKMYMREMLKPAPMAPMQMPVPRPANLKKGDK